MFAVSLRVREWIEISLKSCFTHPRTVSLRVREWIEIRLQAKNTTTKMVSLRVREWIEMAFSRHGGNENESLPPCEGVD